MADGVIHLLVTYISDKYNLKKKSAFPHKQGFPHWHSPDAESLFYS